MLLQLACLISQSVVLGYLTEYFGINEPTYEETRNAYLYAAGKLRVAVFDLEIFFVGWGGAPFYPVMNFALFFQCHSKHYHLILPELRVQDWWFCR